MARDTIVDRFLKKTEELAERPALWAKRDGAWKSTSWEAYGGQCRRFAGGLLARGLDAGASICIIGFNRPEWVVSDIGAMLARVVPVGIYQTNSPSEVVYIANHCEAALIVVEDHEQYLKIAEKRDELDFLETIVMMEDADAVEDAMVVGFEAFLDEGRDHLDAVDARIAEITTDDLGTMIYTSGTTGPPKGVMLSHDNLAFTASIAQTVVGGMKPEDCMVSYLPLSHIAEQMFTIHLPATFGYPIWFAEDVPRVREAIEAARPTVFFGVPRVWEKFKAALENGIDEATGLKAGLLGWSQGVGRKAGYQTIEHGQPRGFTGLQHALAKRLVFDKLKDKLGFDRLRIAVSAAAPIGIDVLEFFLSFDIVIREIYGQSEGCGPTTANYVDAAGTRLGSVGRPLPDVDVRIADDGEILVRGRNIFSGYYKMADETAETLVDGWLHSGDIGRFDEDGFLYITDRKKDLIITAGGKNIAPQKIEKLLRKIDGIGQAAVIGDRRKYLAALVTIDPERAPRLAEERGWPADPQALAAHAEFRDYVEAGVARANEELARVETIKRFEILPMDWSQETDELTPTQKVKRRVVAEKYSEQIESLYTG